jgi:thymidylate kinase
MALIIIEGPDGVGKSTLVQRIVDVFGSNNKINVLKAGPPRGHPLDEYVLPLLKYRHGEFVICDRWHLGELVYPTVLDRPTKMSTTVLSYVEKFLASRGAIVVHVTDHADSLERVLAARGDDLVLPEQAKLMIDLFADAALDSTLPVIEVEARDTSDDTVSAIISFAMRQVRPVAPLADFVTYVGRPRPRFLLMGDVRGVNGPAPYDLRPAFMPYPGSCGEYLLRAVESSFTPHERVERMAEVGIANANDVDDVYKLWKALERPVVVGLGHKAQVTLCRRLPGYTSSGTNAPHPQYWKRFRHRDYEEYGTMITGSWES